MFHVEQWTRHFSILALTDAKVTTFSFQTRRSACFEANKGETKPFEAFGHLIHGGTSVASAFLALFANPDASAKGGSSGNYYTAGVKVSVMFGSNAAKRDERDVAMCLWVGRDSAPYLWVELGLVGGAVPAPRKLVG